MAYGRSLGLLFRAIGYKLLAIFTSAAPPPCRENLLLDN